MKIKSKIKSLFTKPVSIVKNGYTRIKEFYNVIEDQSKTINVEINSMIRQFKDNNPSVPANELSDVSSCFDNLNIDENNVFDTLSAILLRTNYKPELNELINKIETSLKFSKLASFPPTLGINLSSACNIQCKFCSIINSNKSMMTIEQFEAIEVIPFLKELTLFAGPGESTINPDFKAIIHSARTRFPKLRIGFFTNGVALNEELVNFFISEKVDWIHNSLNAGTKETFQKLTGSNKFDIVIDSWKRMSTIKKEKKIEYPQLSMSMVLVKDNMEEMCKFVQLVKDCGASNGTFCHFQYQVAQGEVGLDKDQSLYHCPDLSNTYFEKSRKLAQELDIPFWIPPNFGEEANIFIGTRIPGGPITSCNAPWSTFYLFATETGELQTGICCSWIYNNVKWDRSDLTLEAFRALWNHPIYKYFRETSNCHDKSANPLCYNCFLTDKFSENYDNKAITNEMYSIYSKL